MWRFDHKQGTQILAEFPNSLKAAQINKIIITINLHDDVIITSSKPLCSVNNVVLLLLIYKNFTTAYFLKGKQYCVTSFSNFEVKNCTVTTSVL